MSNLLVVKSKCFHNTILICKYNLRKKKIFVLYLEFIETLKIREKQILHNNRCNFVKVYFFCSNEGIMYTSECVDLWPYVMSNCYEVWKWNLYVRNFITQIFGFSRRKDLEWKSQVFQKHTTKSNIIFPLNSSNSFNW